MTRFQGRLGSKETERWMIRPLPKHLINTESSRALLLASPQIEPGRHYYYYLELSPSTLLKVLI